jgi:hypothetical protein
VKRAALAAALGALGALAGGGSALAGKHAILVLKSDGNADAKVKAKVDAAVVKLAQQSPEGTVTPGDISYADAAAAAGCKPEAAACANDVINTFATDEIVIVSVARKPGTLDITVRRATKTGKPREITASVPADAPELQLDAVNTLFGLAAPPPAPVVPPPVAPANPPPTEPPPPVAITTTTADHPGGETALPPDHAVVPPANPAVMTPPPGGAADDGEGSSHKLIYVGGMIGGGLFALIGMGLWSSAGDIQNEIDSAPKKTVADFKHVQDLESQGDSKARAGNVMFVIGVGVGAVATYLFIRDRHHHNAAQQHAMIGPTLFDHGAGLAFTFGPTP